MSPESLCRPYRDAGYDFLALTDHRERGTRAFDTSEFRVPSFTTLLRAEVHRGLTNVGEPWHLVLVGLPEHLLSTPSTRRSRWRRREVRWVTAATASTRSGSRSRYSDPGSLIVEGFGGCPPDVSTDAIAALVMLPGVYPLGDLEVTSDGVTARLGDGRLAGSVLRLDQAILLTPELEIVATFIAGRIAHATDALASRFADVDADPR